MSNTSGNLKAIVAAAIAVIAVVAAVFLQRRQRSAPPAPQPHAGSKPSAAPPAAPQQSIAPQQAKHRATAGKALKLRVKGSGRFNDFTLGEIIGRGAGSVVRRAVQIANTAAGLERDRECVVKLVDFRAMPHAQRRKLEREVEILASLSHRHVVKMYHWWWSASHLNIALECLGGELFEHALERGSCGQRFSEREVRDVTRVLLSVCAYLHDECGLVHRDIKLENVLLCRPSATARLRRRSNPTLLPPARATASSSRAATLSATAGDSSSSSSSSEDEEDEDEAERRAAREAAREAARGSSSESEGESWTNADADYDDPTLSLPYFADGTVAIKLGDFGTACRLPARGFVGSPGYIAPEMLQLWGKAEHAEIADAAVEYDEAVDVWSVGVCAHILLSGVQPPPIDKLVGIVARGTTCSGNAEGDGDGEGGASFDRASEVATVSSWREFAAQLLTVPEQEDDGYDDEEPRVALSATARAFTASLLEPHRTRRPRAANALHHRWLAGRGAPLMPPTQRPAAAASTGESSAAADATPLRTSTPRADDGSVPVRAGFLSMRSEWQDGWRRRYFTLHHDALRFATGPNRLTHGAIQLRACSAAAGEKGGCCFVLTEAAGSEPPLSLYGLAKHELRAESEAERDAWLSDVAFAVDTA